MAMREGAKPRFVELVIGRMLELVVRSIEGTRERWDRTRALAH
jgi:hypothetical protein